MSMGKKLIIRTSCFIFLLICSKLSIAQTFELADFVKAIEQNSIQLSDNKAQFESMLSEGKSNATWEYPFIEGDWNTTRENNRTSAEWNAALVVKPKLWWVNSLLRESLKTKGMQYQKSQNLIRNINFIGAKKIYLTYVATKEKYHYFLKREENFLKLLSIAQKRLNGGSISQKDYVSFKSAYIDSTLASVAVKNELIELQKSLFMFMGLDTQHFYHSMDYNDDMKHSRQIQQELQNTEITTKAQKYPSHIHNDILIKDLQFDYIAINKDFLQAKLQDSLYTQILDLQAKEYQSLAKYESRNLWSTLELVIGANYSLSSYNPYLQVSIPLPVTKKQSYLKAKYMALESGAVTKSGITKKHIAIKANAYLQELILQRHYIDIAKNNIEVKQHLAELNRLGYEAQQVTLFEYITQENAFVDSQIELVNSQIKYINLVALLEETLGESFTKID